jgi:energy-coupling factor transport system permease protein
MIHPLAWMAWLSAVLAILSLTRNPWYLLLVLLWLALVDRMTRPAAEAAPALVSPLRFGVMVVTLPALFNALTVHFGGTVLFRLPKLLPLVGGAITLEALVFGLLNGLTLTGIFAAFTIITRALPVRSLIQLIPRAFYPVAVVASIAITFVPVTLRQFQQIREAQAVRGHRLRGLRDGLPLLMPLLSGGLERALQLAEAMTARGFASTNPSAHDAKTRLVMVVGLSLLLGGWLLRLVGGQATWGLSLLLLGAILIAGTLWVVGRRTPHTVYRPTPWSRRDWRVSLSAALVVAAFLVSWPGFDRSSIFYYPYPILTLPGFNWGLGLTTLGLLGPIWPLYFRGV